jgi:PHD/YefM family antitoxin component YafN of YafNO toxin-antitoxin module
MSSIRVGVREFRENIAKFLESEMPVAVTRRGETLGVYVPTPRRQRDALDVAELKAAADKIAEAMADVDEQEVLTEFKRLRRQSRKR